MSQETPVFIDALKSLIKKLNSAKDTGGAQITDEDTTYLKDTTYLREKLIEFKTACESADKKTAKAVLKDLKQKELPRRINDILDALSVHLLHSDFEKAASDAENAVKTELSGVS